MIEVKSVDHLGIRVTNEADSIAFYEQLGFKVERRADGDTVTILRNAHGIELNLVYNGVDLTGGKNILMDVPEKHTGYTHVALNVSSVSETFNALRKQILPSVRGPCRLVAATPRLSLFATLIEMSLSCVAISNQVSRSKDSSATIQMPD